MRAWLPLLGLLSCGPDPKPTTCPPGPDFVVVISAARGSLPSDTVLRLYYGGGDRENPEEFRLAEPGIPTVLFCAAADREGNVIDAGLPSPGSAGAGGEGGGTNAARVDALRCEVWSYGAAELEIETSAYPMQEPVSLTKKRNACVVETEIVLEMPDAGS